MAPGVCSAAFFGAAPFADSRKRDGKDSMIKTQAWLVLILLVAAGIAVAAQVKRSRRAYSGSSTALLHPAWLHARAPEVYDAQFHTTKGDFTIRVTRSWSPHGADRFYNLVRRRFYNGASFFRVLPGFVVQFGISPEPRISRAWAHATIPDDPVLKSNLRGYVSFATAGPNTRTTQVFINLGENAQLDSHGFSPFGQVVEGMSTVDQLYSGYGEGAPQGEGPDQSLIGKYGKSYLEKHFPKLDSIITARLTTAGAEKHPG